MCLEELRLREVAERTFAREGSQPRAPRRVVQHVDQPLGQPVRIARRDDDAGLADRLADAAGVRRDEG
jgi:hypothetical protein